LAKSFLTEYRLELGSLLALLFGFLTVISIVGVLALHAAAQNPVESVPSYLLPIKDYLSDPFGRWVYWLVVAAPIGLVVCAWWTVDYFRKVRELAKLIDTSSKAKFVRNMDDIEYLAWSLPKKFEDHVIDKKKEFKL
jgi:H+/Cl- antiporter ClcA